MTDSTSSVDSSGGTSSSASSTPVTFNEEKQSSLRSAGYTDEQIEALMALADSDDQGNSVSSTNFYGIDKTTLNALRYSGQLTEEARQIVYVQTPAAMLKQVGDPANWEGDNYVGPGAATVNAYAAGEAVDFKKPTLDALVMSVLTARAEIVETQLREQISSIQEKNKELEVANTWLAKAKERKAQAGTSGTSHFDDEFKEYWDSLGAQYQTSSRNHNSADWDVNTEGLKAKIEALTSQSQLETTKLQQTINKYNQTFEMLSNFINKYYQSLSTVIQNLR